MNAPNAPLPSRAAGTSALRLPVISLGLWQNFGSSQPFDRMTEVITTAFEAGITHFDLANNYGPPPGYAEEAFGRILRDVLPGRRDQLIVSSKAGYDMWSGEYGSGGSKKHLRASLDQTLRRLGLDYVDVFYSHRFDPKSPIDETMGALADAVTSGKALYAGISSYSVAQTQAAAAALAERNVPLTLHQPSYSMFNRWIEHDGLLDTLGRTGTGCVAFSVLAQGMLTTKYLDGVPHGSRASRPGPLNASWISDDAVDRIRGLDTIARGRGQTLPQMAIAWALRDTRVTTALIGASSATQLHENLRALDALEFAPDEAEVIDELAIDLGIDLWARSRLAGTQA
jgi:L-glyceraldehyde 3-phosphate reductase